MATKAQLAANARYHDKLETLRFRVPIGKGDLIKAHAERKGQSLNGYINALIEHDMAETKENQPENPQS